MTQLETTGVNVCLQLISPLLLTLLGLCLCIRLLFGFDHYLLRTWSVPTAGRWCPVGSTSVRPPLLPTVSPLCTTTVLCASGDKSLMRLHEASLGRLHKHTCSRVVRMLLHDFLRAKPDGGVVFLQPVMHHELPAITLDSIKACRRTCLHNHGNTSACVEILLLS